MKKTNFTKNKGDITLPDMKKITRNELEQLAENLFLKQLEKKINHREAQRRYREKLKEKKNVKKSNGKR